MRRDDLVIAVAEVLASGKPTYFAFESTLRHAIRSQLCLDGFAWKRADQYAEQVVSAALSLIGAERPSWDEGQREYTDLYGRTFCANPECRKRIVREEGNYQRRLYCSDVCRHVMQGLRYRRDRREEARATTRAWRTMKTAEAPVRKCETCGKAFRKYHDPRRPPPRFCSKSCAATWSNRRREHSWRAQVEARAAVKRLRPERDCALCGAHFYPKQDAQRFCSRNCSQKANSRARWKAKGKGNGHAKANGNGQCMNGHEGLAVDTRSVHIRYHAETPEIAHHVAPDSRGALQDAHRGGGRE